MEINKIYNEDCLKTLARMEDNSVDLIITSPPYNKNAYSKSNTQSTSWRALRGTQIPYDAYDDNLPPPFTKSGKKTSYQSVCEY